MRILSIFNRFEQLGADSKKKMIIAVIEAAEAAASDKIAALQTNWNR